MNRQTYIRSILSVTFIALLLLAAGIASKPEEAYAAKHFSIKGSYEDKAHTKVRIKWKPARKMAAFRIKVYRGSEGFDLTDSAKLGSRKRSYVVRGLEKDEWYTVVLFGYSKKSAKKKYRIAKSIYTITNGVSTIAPDWFGEDWDAYSKDYVRMDWFTRDTSFGISADGIQIYKKVNDGEWQKLVTLKKGKKYVYVYRDRDIEFGNTYTYKARAYARIKKNGKTKTRFGRFSADEVCEIFNSGPVFSTENEGSVPESETASQAVLTATAANMNFDTVFHFGEGDTEAYVNNDLWADVYPDIEKSSYWTEHYMPSCPVFIVKEYRIEGGEWQEAKGDVTVSRNETISFRFEGKTESDTCNTKKWVEFVIPGCTYNGKKVYGLIILTNGYNGCTINDGDLDED